MFCVHESGGLQSSGGVRRSKLGSYEFGLGIRSARSDWMREKVKKVEVGKVRKVVGDSSVVGRK